MRNFPFLTIAIILGLTSGCVVGQEPVTSEEDSLEPVTVHGNFGDSSEVGDETESVETSSAEQADSSAEAEPEPQKKELTPEEREAKRRDEELKALRRERELLSLRNTIRSEKAKAELAGIREERDRLSAQNALFVEQVKSELIEQRGDLERLDAKIDGLNKELSLATTQMRLDLQTELAELKKQQERMDVESAIAQKQNLMELERLRVQEMAIKVRRSELEAQFAELQGRLSIEDKTEEVKDRAFVSAEHQYSVEPYQEGVLRISDRRIALNGPIWPMLSSHVSERINFFNNQSTEYPIFIVIDSSPGGSVWAGSRILKAMESSEAPVYVVVKSYAASMAAIITTLAERSYAYPNALILHHELGWAGVTGNLSQQKEYADDAKEWWRRIATPVAEKMGIDLDEFRKQMYEKSRSGDWMEFADVAQSYNWVDRVVDNIWETSIDRNPDRYGRQMWAMETAEVRKDDKGRSYIELPRLEPFDFYFLFDPTNYYRVAD